MPPTTISSRILGCMFLILLLQCGDATKFSSRQADDILTTLRRIEIFIKQAEQSALSCIVPIEKLHSLISKKSAEESDELKQLLINPGDTGNQKVLKSGLQQRNRNTDHNENINANVNANINANQLRTRRTLESLAHLPKMFNQNSNFNMNTNVNKYRADSLDSDELTK